MKFYQLALAATLFAATSLHGATINWDGGTTANDLWNFDENWAGNATPTAVDDARFPDAPAPFVSNVDVNGQYTVLSMIFDSPNISYLISPSDPSPELTLTNNAISVEAGNTQFVNITLNTPGVLTITGTGGTGQLTFAGDNSGFIGTGIVGGITLDNIQLNVSSFENLGNPAGFFTFTNTADVLEAGASFVIPPTYNINLGASRQAISVLGGETLTINCDISGSGPTPVLEKLEAGTLVLNGTNSFSGGVRVTGGILSVNDDANMGQPTGDIVIQDTLLATNTFSTGRTVTLQDGGPTPTISVSGNQTFTLTGPIGQSIPGVQLRKEGPGTLAINGSTTYTGDTTVAEGILSLNSTLSGNVIVDTQGTLRGNNGQMAQLQNDGVVGPGNSIGTLFVTGDYTQGAAGIFELEINAAGDTDLLVVGGLANLNGDVRLFPEPGLYMTGTTYDFLTTMGGINGAFSSLIEDSPLDYRINYLPEGAVTFAQLEILASSTVQPIPTDNLNGNALSVAEYVFCPEEINVTNTDFIAALSAILTQTPDNYKKALINLSPAQYGALPLQNLNKDIAFSTSLVDQIEQQMMCDRCKSPSGQKPGACQKDVKRTSIWGTKIGQWQKQDGIQEQYGFHDQTYGFQLGVSHLFRNHLNLSGGTGYSYSDMHWQNSKGKANTNALYVAPSIGYAQNNYFVNLLAQFAANWNSVDRNIRFPGLSRTAHSHFVSYDLLARLDGGYTIRVNDLKKKQGPFLIIPQARLSYLNTWQGSFSENGAGSLNLNVKSKYTALLQPEVLMKILKEYYVGNSCVIPLIKAGYVAKVPFSSSTCKATMSVIDCPSDMSVKSFDWTSNQLMLGAGLIYKTLEHLTAAFDYEAHLFDKNMVQTAKINFDWAF